MARESFRLRRYVGAGDLTGVGSYVRGLDTMQTTAGASVVDQDSAIRSTGITTSLPVFTSTSAVDAGESVFEGQAIEYNAVVLNWSLTDDFVTADTVTTGNVGLISVAVVYSTTGFPETVVDGELLVSGTTNNYLHQQTVTIGTDAGPLYVEKPEPGKWAYYTLFAYYNADGVNGSYFYDRLASIEVLVPKDYGSRTELWNRIPTYYREMDINNNNQFERFIDTFGFELDRNRTLIDSVMTQYDPLLADAEGVEQLATMLGLELNVDDIGVSRTRSLLHDIGYLRRTKGTLESVRDYITAVSGSDVTITTGASAPFYTFNVHAQRANLVADPRFLTNSGVSWNVAQQPAVTRTNLITNPNFEVNTTGWTGSGTFARTTAQFYSGVASMSLTYTGSGTVLVEQSTRPVVTAGLTYTASFYMKQSVNAGLVVCNFMWYNAAGSLILDDSHQSNDPTTEWQRFSYTRTAPANAVSCSFRVYQFLGEGGGAVATVNFVDAFLIEQASSALPYFDGTYVNDYQGYGILSKGWSGTANASTSTASWFTGNTRTNLVNNPNFEVNTTGWGVDAVTTLARSTAQFYSGTASGLATITNNTGAAGINNLSARNPATAGLSYTASAYVRLNTGTAFPYYVALYFYDAAGSILSAPSATATTMGSAWERKSVTATAPANTVSVGLGVFRSTALTGTCSFYVDAIMVEQSSSALPYFDGTYADTYTGYTLNTQSWNGTANASTSTTSWYTTNLLPTISTAPAEGIQITAGASGNKIAVVSNVAVPVSANNLYYISADFSALPQIVYGGSWGTSSTWTDWTDATAADSISVGVDGRYTYLMNATTSGTKYPAFLLNLSAGQSITLSKWMVEPNSVGQFFDGDTVFSGFLYQGFTSDHTWSGTKYASYSLYTTNRKKTQTALTTLMPKILPVTLMGTSGGNAKYLMQFDWIPGKT